MNIDESVSVVLGSVLHTVVIPKYEPLLTVRTAVISARFDWTGLEFSLHCRTKCLSAEPPMALIYWIRPSTHSEGCALPLSAYNTLWHVPADRTHQLRHLVQHIDHLALDILRRMSGLDLQS